MRLFLEGDQVSFHRGLASSQRSPLSFLRLDRTQQRLERQQKKKRNVRVLVLFLFCILTPTDSLKPSRGDKIGNRYVGKIRATSKTKKCNLQETTNHGTCTNDREERAKKGATPAPPAMSDYVPHAIRAYRTTKRMKLYRQPSQSAGETNANVTTCERKVSRRKIEEATPHYGTIYLLQVPIQHPQYAAAKNVLRFHVRR